MTEGLITTHIQCITEKPYSLAFCYTTFRATCSQNAHSLVNFTGSFACRQQVSYILK